MSRCISSIEQDGSRQVANMDKLIVNLAPTGILPTKEMTSHVPISVSEIIEDVHRACELGITMLHLHARDELTGKATWRAETYEKIISGIRSFAPELIICVSLSGRMHNTFEQRSEVLSLQDNAKPDMGSLTLGSLNFSKESSINDPRMIAALAEKMMSCGIMPELEVFDSGMINYAKYLEGKGLVRPPHYFNLIIGNIASSQADPLHVGAMIRDLPKDSLWSIGGIGNAQLPMNLLSMAVGGGVRIGIEDNIWFDSSRTMLADNSSLTKRIHDIMDAAGKKLMTSAEMRKRLGLQPGSGFYGKKLPLSQPFHFVGVDASEQTAH